MIPNWTMTIFWSNAEWQLLYANTSPCHLCPLMDSMNNSLVYFTVRSNLQENKKNFLFRKCWELYFMRMTVRVISQEKPNFENSGCAGCLVVVLLKNYSIKENNYLQKCFKGQLQSCFILLSIFELYTERSTYQCGHF